MITYGRSPNKNKPAPTIQPPRTKKGPKAGSAAQQSYQQSKEAQKARRKLQRTVADLEEQMNQLGEQQEQVETQMADPDVATDIGKLTDLQKSSTP